MATLFAGKYNHLYLEITSNEVNLYSEDKTRLILSVPNTMAWKMALGILNNMPDLLMFATDPIDWSVLVSIGDPIEITFTHPISSITFQLRDNVGNVVAWTGAFDVTNKIYTFTPTNPLSANTLYTASFSVIDTTSNSLLDSFSFTTEDSSS